MGATTPSGAKDALIKEGIEKSTAAAKLFAETVCVAVSAGTLVLQPELEPLVLGACSAAKAVGLF